MLAAAQRRAAERERLRDPASWGVANDTVALATGDNVHAHRTTKRIVHANRLDPFDALHRAGGLSHGQHQAAKRLFKDWCERMGIRTEDPRPLLQKIDQQGSRDLVTVAMVDAGRRFDTALSLVGRADATVLNALVQPSVMCGTTHDWRGEVRRVTGEAERHCQGSIVRQACENLRLAYAEMDNARWESRQAAAASQTAGVNDMARGC